MSRTLLKNLQKFRISDQTAYFSQITKMYSKWNEKESKRPPTRLTGIQS